MEWRYAFCSSKCKCQLQTMSKVSNPVSDWLARVGDFRYSSGSLGVGSIGRNALDLHPHRAAASSSSSSDSSSTSLSCQRRSRVEFITSICVRCALPNPLHLPFFPRGPHMGNLIQMSFHTLRRRALEKKELLLRSLQFIKIYSNWMKLLLPRNTNRILSK